MFAPQTGVLNKLSEAIFDDEEHLVHLFETVHFMLFFVMIVYLIEACVYLQAHFFTSSRP